MNLCALDLARSVALVAVVALLALPTAATNDEKARDQQETTMQATGPFEVQLAPQGPDEATENTGLGRMSLDKEFQGDLVGTSKGQMLMFRSQVQGSAGYVAMEAVTGALADRKGSFVLQHSSTMDRGAPKQSIVVVPDSGTGELEGLAGTMEILNEDGKHSYVFDYTLPAASTGS